MEDIFELSLPEIAILDFTNDGFVERPEYIPFKPKEPLILTTKTSYLWAATLATIIEERPDIDESQVISSYRTALNKNREEINRYYDGYMAHMGYHPPFEGAHFYGIHVDFVKSFDLHGKDIIRKSQDVAEKAYQSLTRKGLIEDPVFTTAFGVSIAVIGFVPFGFTSKTRRGRTTYRKIEAALWSYEQKEERGQRITNVKFRLWKILKAFKKALAEVMEEETEKSKE